jgi:branched-subunit amino acid transport protein
MKTAVLLLILGMGVVTYLPRCVPLFVLQDRRLPDWLLDWLALLPAAILSALLIPELVLQSEPRELTVFNTELLVAVPTFLLAWWTRSLGLTVIFGMALYWGVGKIL